MTQLILESSSNNSAAASHQDQGHPTDQNPSSQTDTTEKATLQQPIERVLLDHYLEERSCNAIWDIWPSAHTFTDEEKEEFLQGSNGPLPDDEEDDFADEPVSKYNPADPTPEWAKPEAWTDEKDSKGRTI
ncbi:hypothetical protein PVAG01_10436 [Phlyctema vagabunda]|uniref:Uncharacterized protein n=1 Tax=Phlyctema vagabunda TaxID=108571 RepID=A0ABR4P616_9HELO